MPAWDTVEQIKNLRSLESGWNSYDAAPVAQQALEWAITCAIEAQRFFGEGYSEPIVGPTPDGGVALIWRRPGRGEVAVLFSSSGAKYVVVGPDRQVTAQGPISDPFGFPREVLKPP